jgi:rSAM/selenodomain-associated transferase 1
MAQRIRQLVIFLRAPLRGGVKRRLAADIGPAAAHDFYLRTSRDLVRRLGRDPRWRLILAVTPDHLAPRARFWDMSQGRIAQGSGDLGARMGRVFSTRPPGPVVIIGSDIPGITKDHIEEAFARLAVDEAVFGPAADGGYWLIGLARRQLSATALAPRLFRSVRWSTEHALEDTRANLPRGAEALLLPVLEDIDDGASYSRYLAAVKGAKF